VTKVDELQLVEKARRGDVDSLGELYRRYYSSLVWLAYSVVGDREAAEDAAQESFAVACEKLGQLRRPERFGGWLAGICRNLAVQMVRSNGRRAKSNYLPEVVAPTNGNGTAEKMMRQAMGELGQGYRELLLLHYFEGLCYEEIGRLTEMPVHRVKSRLFRARRKIAKILDHEGFEWNRYER